MARTVMGDVLYMMDITESLLLCLSAEPRTARDVMATWMARSGREATAMSVIGCAHRLTHLAGRGLVSNERRGPQEAIRYAITPAGEEYADRLYSECL